MQSAELAIDRVVDLPRGFAYVEYETRVEAEKAKLHMDGGQLDGNVITCASPIVKIVFKLKHKFYPVD